MKLRRSLLSALAIVAGLTACADDAAPRASPCPPLDSIVIPEIMLRSVPFPEAISNINAAIAQAVTSGPPPVIALDLTPTKVTITRAPHAPALDPYMAALEDRWRQRNAWRLMVPQGLQPITFSARHISAAEALKIVTAVAGVPLRSREGQWLIGGEAAIALECRPYPLPAAIVEYLEVKPGLEGADGLEVCFHATGLTVPPTFSMMLVPDTHVILLLGEASHHAGIGRVLREWGDLSADECARLSRRARTVRETNARREGVVDPRP
jgi:hypothetical protein